MSKMQLRMATESGEPEGMPELQEKVEAAKMIPYGYCHCGCGEKTNIISQNIPSQNLVKGEPYRYIAGHQRKGIIKNTCVNGHLKTPENTLSRNRCKICSNEQAAKKRRLEGKRIKKRNICINGHKRTPENLNNTGGCKLCVTERYVINKDSILAKMKENYSQDPEYYKHKAKLYRSQTEVKAKQAIRHKKDREDLISSYVATIFKTPTSDLHPQIIEAKRSIIKANRTVRAYLKGELNEQS